MIWRSSFLFDESSCCWAFPSHYNEYFSRTLDTPIGRNGVDSHFG
jgi:hypothetical protein